MLAHGIVVNDLRYSQPVTAADAAMFADPQEMIYRFRKQIGHLFQDEL